MCIRGRGLARKALEFSIEWCKDNCIRDLILTVNNGNSRARMIYEKAGFSVTKVLEKNGSVMMERGIN